MKLISKNIKLSRVFLLGLLLLLAVIMIACAGQTKGFDMPGEPQDLSYTVKGNGSQVVQYGNYVYFINGYRGYEDEDGEQNKDVKKGGLYRAELYGKKGLQNVTEFGVTTGFDFDIQNRFEAEDWTQQTLDEHNATAEDSQKIDDEDYEFKASRQLERVIDDEDSNENDDTTDIVDSENWQNVVNVNRLSNKTIGTSGYKQGGLWIFDNYLYFATPSNERDKSGTVVYKKTDFYRVKLDGQKAAERIYKTKNESSDSPYAFYKQNGKVYLTVLDGTDIVSVATTNKKIEKPIVIAQNATTAIMHTDSDYYDGYNVINGTRKYTVHDYIAFSRPVDSNDVQKTGNVVEIMRPDGTDRQEIFETGQNIELDSVRDGLLFYKNTRSTGNKGIEYTNLQNIISDCLYSGLVDSAVDPNNSHPVAPADDQFTAFYNFRTSQMTNVASSIATSASGLTFFNGVTEQSFVIYSGTATVLFVDNGYVYFLDGDSFVCRTKYTTSEQDKTEDEKSEKISAQAVNADALQVAKIADYIVYIGKIDDTASDYTMFKKIPPLYGETQEIFVGERLDSELRNKSVVDGSEST